MIEAIRKRVIIGPGGLIEFRTPELHAGTPAEIVVLVDSPGSVPEASPYAHFKALQQSLGLDSDKADAWIRSNSEERHASSTRLEPTQ